MNPGIHRIPMAEYLADPCPEPSLSSGVANELVTRSPYHARHAHPRLNPEHQSDQAEAADIGSIAHALVLEGSDDKIALVDAEDYRTKAARETRDAARAEGRIPILKSRLPDVQQMVGAARGFIAGSEIAGVFDDGEPELTMVWREGPSWCRARPDWLTRDRRIMLHYKTTGGSAEPNSWIRLQMIPMGYDMAAMFYLRGLLALREWRETTTVFLVQETSAPYACSLVGLSPALMDLAEAKVNRALSMWESCMASGRWPAYPSQICYAEPTTWALRQAEEQAAKDEFDPELATQA